MGLLLLLALAAALRLLSYDFSLPYVDHPDEPNYYLAGLEWRGLFDNQGYYTGVPPAYLALHAGLQPALEAVGIRELAPTTRVMRLLSVAANLLTLVCIALTARLAAGDLAGLLAGAAWGIAPPVLENGVYALPDPFVYLFVALALWLASAALVNPARRGWCVGSIVAGLIATLFKYPAFPALGVGVMVALFLAWRDRRRGLRLLAIQVVLITAVGLWLTVIYGVDFNNLQREGAVVKSQGLANFFDLSRTLNNLYYTVAPIQAAAFIIASGLGILAYLIARRRGLARVQIGVIGLAALVGLSIPWLANTFSQVTLSEIRYVLPATAAACVIFGAALAQIAQVLPVNAAYRSLSVALPVIVFVFIPHLREDQAIVAARRLPDWRVDLRQWFDANLAPGTVIVTQDNHKTFNPIWGGIPHRRWVDWSVNEDIRAHSPDEWRTVQKMSYTALPKGEWEALQQTDAGRAYLAHLLPLRTFFQPPATRGPEMVFYRLWRMEHETAYRFGDAIRLTGYDGDLRQAQPGAALTLRFYWAAQTTPADNYSLFIHLTPTDEYKVLAQADGAPARPERPTLTWNIPSETLISLPFQLSIPADVGPGVYRVMIGLYNFTSGQRLPVSTEEGQALGDALELGRVRVTN
jgi:hypothetical protein